MRIINLTLPLGVGDNRVEQFFDAVWEELKSKGDLAPGQADFFNHPDQAMHVTVIVYEMTIMEKLTQALRSALSRTWPERTDLHVIEMILMEDGPLPFGIVRGGKE